MLADRFDNDSRRIQEAHAQYATQFVYFTPLGKALGISNASPSQLAWDGKQAELASAFLFAACIRP